MTVKSYRRRVWSVMLILVCSVSLLLFTLPTKAQTTETDALIDLYNSTNGAQWISNNGWTVASPCTGSTANWQGLKCNSNGNVVEINLLSNNLKGTLPTTLGALGSLEVLNLSVNDISGPIPSEIGSLTSLKTLSLSANDLSDTIPASLGSLPNLNTLLISANNLTGEIPADLAGLGTMTELDIGFNSLVAYDANLITWLNTNDPDWQGSQILGDVNNDGVITPSDATYVANRLQSDDLSADANQDNEINQADMDLVVSQLGLRTGP